MILASGSPRRRDLLNQIGIIPRIYPPDIEEDMNRPHLRPAEIAETLSREKMAAFFDQTDFNEDSSWVLSADTIVVLPRKPEEEPRILGKPAGHEDAASMLSTLRSKTHHVITGFTINIPGSPQITKSVTTHVTMADYSAETLQWYLETKEWHGVAGGYRLQGKGACLVEALEGSFSNVVGLPLRAIYVILRKHNYIFR